MRSRFRSGLGRRFRGLSGVGSGSGRFRSGVTATAGAERHEKQCSRANRDEAATEEGVGEGEMLTTGHHLDNNHGPTMVRTGWTPATAPRETGLNHYRGAMSRPSFRAFRADTSGEEIDRGVVTMTTDDLADDGVLVEVHWSSVNYKDGLASTPTGKVARISPMVPGVDLAGVLLEDAGDTPAGTEVIAHGYDLGVARHGGFAQFASVPPDWIVPLPDGLGLRDAMVIGTAGYTAALSVIALIDHGITPDSGPVLVTGATGGVGSTAVGMLAGLGYSVTASTGKPDEADFLTALGATEIIDRATLAEEGRRPLESMVWAGAVDCVGGVTLANVLKQVNYGGAVAASGLTGGAALPTTVMPFILRGVSLLGIDSVQTPIARRREVWGRIATDLRPKGLDRIGHDISLDDLDEVLTAILRGGATGRNVVDLQRS